MILDHSEDNSADAYDVRLGGQKATFGLADLGRSPPHPNQRTSEDCRSTSEKGHERPCASMTCNNHDHG